jgi:hypothetical protein
MTVDRVSIGSKSAPKGSLYGSLPELASVSLKSNTGIRNLSMASDHKLASAHWPLVWAM